MSVEIPTPAPACWPADWSCVPEEQRPDEADRAPFEAMAAGMLRSLTAHQVGACPVVVRPCAQPCGERSTWMAAPVTWGEAWMHPAMTASGSWVNVTCGCTGSGCSCSTVSEVVLPGPVGAVHEVMIDGVVLAATAYRLDDGNRLVRTDGEAWPRCQDMSAANDAVGAFAVTYTRGVVPDGVAARMLALLAAEYAKACAGQECDLPAGVVSLARAGVSMELQATGSLPQTTGIPVVDAWVRTINPYQVKGTGAVHRRPGRRARVVGVRP